MKRLLVISAMLLCITFISSAQTPQKFNYQAVVRDNVGAVIKNQIVSFRIAIVKNNASGSEVYAETQTPTTNDFGLVNLEIGGGTVISGSMASINWGSDLYFIKIGLDASGGSNYTLMGASQLLSIPYALYAENAGNVADTSSTNELQALSLSNDTLYLSNGGKVYLGAFMDNTDNQSLSINGNNLSITNGNTIQLNVDDNDSDPYNEIQILTISKDTIFLTNSTFIKLPNFSQILSISSNADSSRITNLANPVDDQDAATKSYVDLLNSRISMLEYEALHSSFIDMRDSNYYSSVKIGNQWWMAENLKYLPSVSPSSIGSTSAPYFYVYGYNGTNVNNAKATTNFNTYGVLYNWSAAMQGSPSSYNYPSLVQGVCPAGWHLPSISEFDTLINFLGGAAIAGGKLKVRDTICWKPPNLGATNNSGFSALPGGYRMSQGIFFNERELSMWWSTSEYSSTTAYQRSVNYQGANSSRGYSNKNFGVYVRCVKNY